MKYQRYRNLQWCVAFAALCVAAASLASVAHAATIMKMSLSPLEASNMSFANGVLSMPPDGNANTDGEHNVTIDCVGVVDCLANGAQALSGEVPAGSASVTLTGMMAAGSPLNTGSFIVQVFDFGILDVYDEDNTLMLSADLTKVILQGALGPTSGQGLFTGFGIMTGGSIADDYRADSLQVRIDFPEINGGFSVTGSTLDDFETWTPLVELLATPAVPEPSFPLSLGGAVCMLVPVRRRRRR